MKEPDQEESEDIAEEKKESEMEARFKHMGEVMEMNEMATDPSIVAL